MRRYRKRRRDFRFLHTERGIKHPSRYNSKLLKQEIFKDFSFAGPFMNWRSINFLHLYPEDFWGLPVNA